MKLGTYWGVAHINSKLAMSATLHIEQERIDVSTRGPKADPSWTAVDSAGHFHAMAGKDYPTLRSRQVPVPCDGSCGGICGGEGTSRTEWSCRICAEVVEPGLIPGPHHDSIGGLTDWRVELEGLTAGEVMFGYGDVSVRFDAVGPEPRTFFGVAVQTICDVQSAIGGSDQLYVRMTLAGNGELGDRPLVKELTK